MIVADTDVLVDFLAGRGEHDRFVRDLIAGGQLRTTAINQFELLAGARESRQLQRVETLIAGLEVLSITAGAAQEAASIQRMLLEAGQRIGAADCLIAGTVRWNKGSLLTRNKREFGRVPGLLIEITG